MLGSEPDKADPRAIAKWRELGPVDLEKLIEDKKIEFNPNLQFTVLENFDGNSNYYGQVNDFNEPEGFGR